MEVSALHVSLSILAAIILLSLIIVPALYFAKSMNEDEDEEDERFEPTHEIVRVRRESNLYCKDGTEGKKVQILNIEGNLGPWKYGLVKGHEGEIFPLGGAILRKL